MVIESLSENVVAEAQDAKNTNEIKIVDLIFLPPNPTVYKIKNGIP